MAAKLEAGFEHVALSAHLYTYTHTNSEEIIFMVWTSCAGMFENLTDFCICNQDLSNPT